MPTLYYSPGAVSLAPHILLHELDLEHRLVRVVTGDDEHRRPEYLRVNPLGRLPALVLDGGVLTEVIAVLHYLAAQRPERGLVPSDALELARVNELLSLIASSLHPAYALAVRPDRVVADESTHAPLRRAGRDRFATLLAHIERRMPEGGWAVGERYTIADPYLLVMVLWARYIEVDLAELPRLGSFAARVLARPAVQKALRAEGLVDDAGRAHPPARV